MVSCIGRVFTIIAISSFFDSTCVKSRPVARSLECVRLPKAVICLWCFCSLFGFEQQQSGKSSALRHCWLFSQLFLTATEHEDREPHGIPKAPEFWTKENERLEQNNLCNWTINKDEWNYADDVLHAALSDRTHGGERFESQAVQRRAKARRLISGNSPSFQS